MINTATRIIVLQREERVRMDRIIALRWETLDEQDRHQKVCAELCELRNSSGLNALQVGHALGVKGLDVP